ncbi:MAG: amidohydrolase family protein [Chitinophagaceae bacterium]|nr:amidohydrolase family protein [Chitinophagaceae bacterium]
MKSILSFSFLLLAFSSLAQDSSQYTIYYSNRNAGFIKINRQPNGVNTIHYTYNDRGRGPDQFFTVVTNQQKGIERFEQKGVGYMKDSVSVFIYKKDSLYYNVKGKDTVKTNFKNLSLYNFGRSGLYEFFCPIVTDTVTHGSQSYVFEKILERSFIWNNKMVKGTLYNYRSVNSKTLGLVWLNQKNQLLAEVSPWNDIIENGKESLRPELRRINDSVSNNRLEQQSAELLKKSFNKAALFNCNYVDVEKGTLISNKTIFISNGKIEKITDTSVSIPADYKRINATNKTVMPGLWDMHAHTFPGEGTSYLANGITSIRDLGNNLQLPEVKQKSAEGKLLHPRMAWMCGFIDFNDDMAGPCGVFINNVQEGIEAVRMYKKMGYRSVKLYSSMKPEYVKPIAAEAHKLGLLVHGHVPAHMTAAEAIRDGYDEVNHLNMLVLGYFGKEVDTRTRVRLTLMKERAFEASPNGAYANELITLMQQKNIVLDPTSVLYGPYQQKTNMSKKDSIEKQCTDTLFAWLKVLHQKGIRFVPGTDNAGGTGIVNELKNYAMIGMSNADVLRSGTLWCAQYAGLDKELGSVAEGKVADLIIVSGNPLERIAVLDNIQMVITNGRLFYTKDLKPSGGGNEALHQD